MSKDRSRLIENLISTLKNWNDKKKREGEKIIEPKIVKKIKKILIS